MMNDSLDFDQIKKQVLTLSWVHSIDLGQGLVTPGQWGKPSPLIMKAFDDMDFSGKKVLDVGCWDGLWSFEAEKRGAASVYATDDISQRSHKEQSTFLLAHKALRSKVSYHPNISVYDIENIGPQDFDIVLFCGVYYHLRHPLLALAKLRRMMKRGGMILVEGDVLYGPSEPYAKYFYGASRVGDPSVWWVPTISCLRQWVESSYLEILTEYPLVNPEKLPLIKRAKMKVKKLLSIQSEFIFGISRYAILARSVRRKDPDYLFPDDDLRDYNLNA
jgi:tRNA (mo5U34)-methyltransferase